MLYCCAWPRWWCFLILHFPLLFPSRLPMWHRAEVATLKKQCFHGVLAILVLALKTLNNKTPTDCCCLLLCFQGQLRRTELKCMGCTYTEVLRLQGPSRSLLSHLWRPHQCGVRAPQPAEDCQEVKKGKDLGTQVLFPHFFLKWRVVCIKGRGKISTLMPVHLPRGWAGLTCPDPHTWEKQSAHVGWQDEQCQAWSKAFQSQWEHFHSFQGLGLRSWTSTNERYCTHDNLFFRAMLPEHHQQNSKTNSKVLVYTTLLLLSRAEI